MASMANLFLIHSQPDFDFMAVHLIPQSATATLSNYR